MDIILSFAALRPVTPAGTPALTLSSNSDFQRQLSEASSGDSPLADATALAQEFAGTSFLRSADEVAYGSALMSLLDNLRGDPLPSLDRLASDVQEALHNASPDTFADYLTRARDSVVAAYLLPDAPKADVAQNLVRVYSLARAVLTGSPTREEVESILRGPMALPDDVLQLRSSTGTTPFAQPDEPTAREQVDKINALAERHQLLSQTLEEIDLHAEDELVLSELGKEQPLSSLYRAPASRGHTPTPGTADASAPRKLPIQVADQPDLTSPLLRAGARRNVLLSSKALELLPSHAAGTLRSLNLDPATTSVADMRCQVLLEYQDTGQQLLDLSGSFAARKEFDPAIYDLKPAWNLDPVDAPDAQPPVNTVAPTTHTAVKPLGVADLLLVRAHVSHYERSEVAAIESVLAHEKLTHTVRRLDTSETTTTADQESTDLRTQVQTTAEQDNGHTTVQAVGPGVGPLAAEGASSFAKSVTDQVTSSSTNRIRRLATERQLRESEDTLEHLFDNSTGTAETYGVYQWLDKLYTAQIFSYGSRLLYDIIVPEPAAMFREALARPRSGLRLPVKPAPFAVAPTKLTLDNWAYYASGHHATGVDAPPQAEIVITEPFGGRSKDEFASDSPTNTLITSETRSTRIPKGYRAKRYRVVVQANGYDSGALYVLVGSKYFTIRPANGTFVRSGALNDETESLPVGVTVDSDGVNWGVLTIAVGVEIICEATDELFSAWQVKAHGLILDANRRRFQEYEEAIANRDASARIFLQSLPANRKVSIVQTEMTRAALEVLTGQSFTGFNATRNDAMGFPFPDAVATVGLSAYIRFFEQAVEWEHLAYAFYPYFWGAQTSWVSKLLASESDVQFASFLTSGAARIVLPIRRGYEVAFERFLNTGATPATPELLDVGSALWVSLVDELRHQSAEDWQETAVGKPWQFRIASDLVRARTDGSMPKWTLTQGKWKDAPDPDF
jgi:hypothetical protein